MKKQPFTAFVNADNLTVNCPCGASITGEGDIIREFYVSHLQHTNKECIETFTPDALRFCIPEKNPSIRKINKKGFLVMKNK